MGKGSADKLKANLQAQQKDIQGRRRDTRFEKAETVLSAGAPAERPEVVTRVDRTSLSYLAEEGEILNEVYMEAVRELGDPKAVKQSHLLRVGIRLLKGLKPKELAAQLRSLPPIPAGNRGRKGKA